MMNSRPRPKAYGDCSSDDPQDQGADSFDYRQESYDRDALLPNS